ncbi:MAG: hypothetical protein FJX23_03170 [Alphaproteobacteria bacterium]|nr:hypothetical protein [Alphaproteobacteria bacterium]
MAYSTSKEIRDFVNTLLSGVEDDIRQNGVTPHRRPMWVLDMDGNVAFGYNVAPGKTLELAAGDDPKTQAIPSDQDLGTMLENGLIDKALFSTKPMDSRLPKNMVESINAAQKEGRNFDIVLLTSRSTKDAMRILELSGVEHPDKVSLIGDSGAVMRIGGKEHVTRELKPKEKAFLDGLGSVDVLPRLEGVVDKVLAASGHDFTKRPSLHIEQKGIAHNLHYGEILKAYGEGEDSALDVALGKALKLEAQRYLDDKSPVDEQKKPVFKILEGPTTLEIKLAAVDKGKGLAAAVDAAIVSGYRPSSVVFAGDDVSKTHADGNVSHGTDQAAFAAAPTIAKDTKIPVYTVHTQHPAGDNPFSDFPYPNKAKEAVGVKPDLILPTPKQTSELVAYSVERALEKGAQVDASARKRIATSLPLGPSSLTP